MTEIPLLLMSQFRLRIKEWFTMRALRLGWPSGWPGFAPLATGASLTFLLAGCVNGGSEPLARLDQDLYADLVEGIPADPAMYELSEVTCEILENELRMTAILTYKLDKRWAFMFDYEATTNDGEVIRSRRNLGFSDPGNSFEIVAGFGRPETFGPDADCKFYILHSTYLAAQNQDKMPGIYETLGR